MIATICSVHALADFLARHLIEQNRGNVWGLSQTTLILPTKRAVKTMKEAFLRISNGQAMLLPKMMPLYEMDVLLRSKEEPISPLQRQLILMKLCRMQHAPDKAFKLATSLATLIDEMHLYGVSFETIQKIVPDQFAEHWQQTIQFLEIIQTHWPAILAERGQVDPAAYRMHLLNQITNEWHQNPPTHPIYAIGFSGGIPPIESFLKTVLDLPSGHLILDGFDKNLSDEDWENLEETHPQYAFKHLLATLGIDRQSVLELGATPSSERVRLMNESMRPAATTHAWLDGQKFKSNVLDNIRLIECASPQTESFTIATELRKVLETPGKTAALITTDRTISRRVIAEMNRWDVLLDDSAGTPLSKTDVGTYLLLLAHVPTGNINDLLALLKHPLATDGKTLGALRRHIRTLEKQARQDKSSLVPELQTNLEPLTSLFKQSDVPFEQLVKTHLSTAEQLATSSDRSGAARLWVKEDGEAIQSLFTELLENAGMIGNMDPAFYPVFVRTLFESESVRPTYGMHPRLDILGPIEARLQRPDVVILAGLNEGTWPPVAESDLWMSRPMRKSCGLPLPEEMIGLSAHDFAHAFSANEVILTRSLKDQGTPTIPSRWVSRLEAVLQASGIVWKAEHETIASKIQTHENPTPCERPAPKPPVSSRPKKLSITQIDTWIKDPYAIYARYILGLRKLDALDEEWTLKDYGTVIHKTLEDFLRLPKHEATLEKLLALGKAAFDKADFPIASRAFWWPKFQNIAAWFVDRQNERAQIPYVEEQGRIDVDGFTLYGKADRIDLLNGEAEIIDYKTGSIPSASPQLALEGILLNNGGFDKLPEAQTTKLSYWHLTGMNGGGEIKSAIPKNQTADQMIDDAMARLKRLIQSYGKAETPYPACPSGISPRYNDYEHLERIREWLTVEETDDD